MKIILFVALLAGSTSFAQVSSIAQGARNVMALAYGSDAVLALPVLDRHSENMEGVAITGHHSDHVGHIFEVVDRDKICSTDPYYKGQVCPEKPMIYNYGGKAAVMDSQDLDISVHGGSGSKSLGVDCSGFVFLALASQGMKLKTKGNLTAHQVDDYAARSYFHFEKTGLNCFEEAPLGHAAEIQSGDILVSPYHIAIVDSAGANPLGYDNAMTMEDCRGLNFLSFNFNLIQSAPMIKGVGINRANGGDYTGMNFFFSEIRNIAENACRLSVSGQSGPVRSGFLRVLRHKDTPECRQSPLTIWNGLNSTN